MWLFDSDAKVLKNLTDILKTDIPSVQSDSTIMRPLMKWSRFRRSELIEALAFGQGPRVKVTLIDGVLLSAFASGAEKEWGRTPNNSNKTGIIMLERRLVEFLEAQLPPRHVPIPKPPVDAALRSLRRFIRNTLLHELVHWANNERSVVWGLDPKTGKEIEAGWKFEKEAQLDRDAFPVFYLQPQRIEDTPLPVHMNRNQEDPLVKALSS